LVNCAGIYGPIGLITDNDVKHWLATININLCGTFLCMGRYAYDDENNRENNQYVGWRGLSVAAFQCIRHLQGRLIRLTETIAKKSGIIKSISTPSPRAGQYQVAGRSAGSRRRCRADFKAKILKQKEDGGVPPEKVAELAVYLASSEADGLSGRLVSLLWDNWRDSTKASGRYQKIRRLHDAQDCARRQGIKMVDKNDKMKIGIIGSGLMGRRRAEALRSFKDVELMAVSSDMCEQANCLANDMKCEQTDTWQQMVCRKDIDVIIVCTPPDCHLPMCAAALENGKHVLCEKPLARNPEEAEIIVKLARQKGLKLKCGFNHRHHPAIQQARKWVEGGVIGQLLFIRSAYGIGGRPGYEKDWRANTQIGGGGQLMDQGMHVIDLARWFLGDFTEVSGFLQTGYWDIAPLEDNAFSLLRTDSG
jgi:hypothetical protein